MKENVEKIYSSFKTGVMIWILSYIMLNVVSAYVGDFSVYNENILKLLEVKNFIAQLLIAGFTYITLEVFLLHFADETIKLIEKNEKGIKKLIKNIVISILVITTLCVALYVLKEKNVISKYVLKLMMTIITFKVVVFCIIQVINTSRYNKKLKEKNKE